MPTAQIHIGREEIAATARVISPHVRRTPVFAVDAADFGLPSASLFLKLELLQHAGSFKTRGAFANLLLREVPAAGVVAASGGNHGLAVAYAAMKLGMRAKIFVPSISSPAKLDRIRSYGADLVVGGDRYADALAAAERWLAGEHALSVHAFDQRETLLGQGTLAMEIEEQVPAVDTVLAAVGGGGLISGIAAWFGGKVRVVGVEPDGAPTLTRALEAGVPVDAGTDTFAADSLAPSRVGEIVLPIVQQFVDRVVLVSDDAIRRAQESLWRSATIVAEPGGAAALAALLSHAYRPQPGEKICVIVCGGNTTAVDFSR